MKRSLVLFAVCLAGMLTGGAALAAYGLPGLAAAEWLLVAGPPVVAAAAGGGIAAGLRLHLPPVRTLAGAVLAGASMWIALAYGVLPLQELIAPMPRELEEALERLVIAADGPPWLVLFALAVTPAICEELLFRGALLPSLHRRLSAPAAIVVTAALFALLHLSPHRLLPTFLLGLAFGTMAIWSGSTLPSMLAHAVNNASVIVLAQPDATPMREALERHGAVAVAVAVVLLTVGLGLVRGRTRLIQPTVPFR